MNRLIFLLFILMQTAQVWASTSPFSLDANIDQYLSHRADVDPYTQFGLDPSYRLNDRQSLEVYQSMTKLYVVDAGNPQILFGDTRLYHRWIFFKDPSPMGFTMDLRSGIAIPISIASRAQGMILGTSFRLSISKPLIRDRLSVSVAPTLRYDFNSYTTTLDGNPVPMMSFAPKATLSWTPTDKLSLEGYAMYSFDRYEAAPYSAGSAPAAIDGSYAFAFSASYQLNPHLAPRFEIYQSDSYIQDGRYEINLYDPIGTRYIVALDISF